MGRDPEAAKTTDGRRPFIAIEAPGPLGGIVTLTAIEGGDGRTLVEAAWTQDGHSHRDSIEADTFEDAHRLATEIADELAGGHAPNLARLAITPPDIEAREVEPKLGTALDGRVFVLGVLLAGIAMVLAARWFGRRRQRSAPSMNGMPRGPDNERPPDT